MKKNFTNEQIVYALRQAESGVSVAEVCRKMGVTEQSFYRWKRKFAGMGVAELQRLRQLECQTPPGIEPVFAASGSIWQFVV